MGRPKGMKNKVVEISTQDVGVKSVATVLDVAIDGPVINQDSRIAPRREVRGEFKRAEPYPKINWPATFKCFDGHVTRGASSYVSVPCCICGMESNLDEIQKETIS